jgi:hypothetical protein
MIEDNSLLHEYTCYEKNIFSMTVINDKCILLNCRSKLTVIDLNTFEPVCE